jgi:hypothetical protein
MFRRHHALLALATASLLALAACGGTSTGQGGSGTPSPSATTTPKPPPTGVPTLSVTSCQGLMSITEANTIMHPATLATAIRVDHGSTGGSCNYEYTEFKPVVSVVFLPFQQGVSLDAIATQALAAIKSVPGATVTKTTVTGVGDQGLYLSATAPIGKGLWEDLLDTTYGPVFISCNVLGTGTPPAASLQSPLTQVCQLVLSRM